MSTLQKTPTTEIIFDDDDDEIYYNIDNIDNIDKLDKLDNKEEKYNLIDGYEEIIEERLNKLRKEFGFYDEENIEDHSNIDECYYCKSRIIMEIEDVREYIEKNRDKRNKRKKIIMLYRLMPYFFEDKMEGIEKINSGDYESFTFRYDIYNKKENKREDLIQCNVCNRRICESHIEFVPFTNIKINEKSKCVCRSCIINYSRETIIKNIK
jgi:hypothetical protein